ncbi:MULTISPECIES: TetR/AcrR family transcriptional regulator [unclassified Streptomyces]|uniref:TetR/AcrR family transcriptional regulator n=1 Tax=unclassified Streptomyces TaxID=2593676 RepID=UPI001BEA3374|nr:MULTISPECIES: TetR/AcrR family transcriptional regulator [unclassified Streptomyces]MBT2407347.1 TetR/AcrR family transcriptional regulator [Streptomyces sp. ISL-21]MBT2455884.1 TetR/AcrR family transcriptional regulator [Streptomyces sp. ISL-86]MBT2609711.1 TetR/AcrR family transcriptional regulator [Streptomyces sp. ISL-87]
MVGSRWSPASPGRRRGSELERAILDTALEQLGTAGWNALTMEGVAAGAHTGKAALYRRWPSKADLVAEVLRTRLPPLGSIPDGGSIREDLYELCVRMREAMDSRAGQALRAVLHECDHANADRFREVIWDGLHKPAHRLIEELVQRGIRRGDVRPDADSPLVFGVIPAMLMYRAKVCGSEWKDAEIAEMIDQVMVPLLRT